MTDLETQSLNVCLWLSISFDIWQSTKLEAKHNIFIMIKCELESSKNWYIKMNLPL